MELEKGDFVVYNDFEEFNKIYAGKVLEKPDSFLSPIRVYSSKGIEEKVSESQILKTIKNS